MWIGVGAKKKMQEEVLPAVVEGDWNMWWDYSEESC